MNERFVTLLEEMAREIADLRRQVIDLRAQERPAYARGTWTPSFTGTTTNGTITYTTQVGEWFRNGHIITFVGRIATSAVSVTPTGTLDIAGLPFPAVAIIGNIAGVATMAYWSANVTNGYTQVAGQILDTASAIRPTRSGDNVTPTSITGPELIAGEWRFGGMYRVG